MFSMVRSKATVTIDREKVQDAMTLTSARSMSEVIDLALDRLIRNEQLRSDLEAYRRQPAQDDEIALGMLPVRLDLDDDDVDYEALYGTES